MDFSSTASVSLAISVALIIVIHQYYKNAYKFWKNRQLDGPKAYPILGSFWRALFDHDACTKWMLQFNKVYGAYVGGKPILVVADPAVVHQICIKDFNVFPNHPNFFFFTKLSRGFLFNTNDDQWRKIRAILSPSFTSIKMRGMYKLLEVSADNMTETLAEGLKSNSVVDLGSLFGSYTLDAIASCCYGLRLAGSRQGENLKTGSIQDEFVKLAMDMFDFRPWRLFMIFISHDTILEKLNLSFIPSEVEWAFARRVQQIVKKRLESNKEFDDFLQILINAQTGLDEETTQSGGGHCDKEQHHVGGVCSQKEPEVSNGNSVLQYKGKLLSEIELLGNATYLLVVGYETTATLLSNCVYTLSFHQEIQEKLYQTVKSLAKCTEKDGATFDYDSLTACKYLDAVISETLRKHPPIFATDRYANEDYYLASHKLHIPKGTQVVFTLKSIMEDPDNWPKPEIFDPERFMPENQHKIKPYSYCPFGVGPRHCLGMRFSLTESKLGLAKLLLKYRFEPAPGTKYPGESKFAFGVNSLKLPKVVAIKR